MPTRINDARIRTFNDTLRAQPEPKVTDQNVLELLAAVGDKWRTSADQLKGELSRPGITRQEQFDLAKKGLSRSESTDLATLLDSGVAMEPGAKNFLEALTGRQPLKTSFGPLTITGDQSQGISGQAKAGDVIEAINLSTAPAGRLHLGDTMEIARADASGKFTGNLPDVREGDIVRMRTRGADGQVSDWFTIEAKGISAADTNNATLNLERLDLAADAQGNVAVTHNTARPFTEPNATIRFTNSRTGESMDIKATDVGSVPADLKLKGQAGDVFKLAVSDGKNNLDLATVAGTLTVPGGSGGTGGVDLPDPALVSDEISADGTPKYKTTRFTGPLFIDGPSPGDVRQGAIGNCYFPAALAAVAHSKPDAIRDMVKQNPDGTFTVKFHQVSYSGSATPVEVTVDGDLYARSFGGPLYGGSLGGSTAPDKMELWFPIVEKAYAQWKGSYDSIGHGGVAGKVMGEVLGKGYDYNSVNASNGQRTYDMIKSAAERGQPMAAGTHGKDQAARYTNTGVYANHAYSVLGVAEENGEKFVLLRNPWGQSEYGHDGKNDGFFKLPLEKFTELYSSLHVVRP